MYVPINVKSPNNISKWQMGFNSVFKGLNSLRNVGRDMGSSTLGEARVGSVPRRAREHFAAQIQPRTENG